MMRSPPLWGPRTSTVASTLVLPHLSPFCSNHLIPRRMHHLLSLTASNAALQILFASNYSKEANSRQQQSFIKQKAKCKVQVQRIDRTVYD